MFIILFLMPILILLSIVFLYRFSGKRLLMHFDLVQFLYSFVFYPLGYIWFKNFLYYIVRGELGVTISVGQWIAADTAITVVFMYFYAFGIIHSLTKTFSLQMSRDPLFDVFEHSEYFHEFITHIGMYFFVFIAAMILAIINLLFPLFLSISKPVFYGLLLSSIVLGIFAYFGLFGLTDKGIKYGLYRRIIKLTYGACFAVLILISFFFDPPFRSSLTVYWGMVAFFGALIASTFFINPTRRIWKIFEHLHLTSGMD